VKVGDLVVRNNRLHPPGKGIVLDSHESAEGAVYFEVQWFDDFEEIGRMWYDALELKVFSESR